MVVVAINNRLKREQCDRTKHDPNFSHWKILIGPSDWEDNSKGKEGSTRYRIHNLPKKLSPGVYELGVAVSRGGLGREIFKLSLDPQRVVVVYLGQADDVRARLQHYGRSGAHLGNSGGSDDSSLQKGRLLFEEIFSQGFPIVYRWAPMQSKEDALRTEGQLLSTFDYAWNAVQNGTRRPDDILQMLNKIASGTRTFSDVAKVLLPFTQKQVGIRIESSKLPLTNVKSDEADNGSYNFLSRVFKFNRSHPRIVQDITGGVIQENAIICGVALGDGSICRKPPAEKRLRCPEHKGMRTNVSTAKAIKGPKSESIVVLDPDVSPQTEGNGYRDQNASYDVKDPRQTLAESLVCGFILDDGFPCRRQPVKGRKRCQEHKGMRINVSTAKAIKAPKSEGIVLEPYEFPQTKGNGYRYRTVSHDVKDPPQTLAESLVCGFILDDGFPCRRQPVKGRKRCQEHKGMRINVSTAKAIKAPKSEGIVLEPYEFPQTKGNGYRYRTVSHDVKDPPQTLAESLVCGFILDDGFPCRRQPVKGRKRCQEHKGMRINVSTAKAIKAPKSEGIVLEPYEFPQTKGNGYRYRTVSHDVKDPPQTLVESPVDEIITNTNICGIILGDGSTCRRQPVKGRKRCLEHKGRRIRASIHDNQQCSISA